ncbi:hypothetical protein PL321_14985 [Caloramator sp. mosi_1]|uniref:hypothetical protein n=1 Tax=Caloramator sp. mosi_1 TaxID=3023090 RepID=UPI00236188E1|nr:hypothetical protein [Caloramator sp. mosi_1]WDC83801.1 hypothetical protein PL321_14985 [Caloramator sp. mosi_1]
MKNRVFKPAKLMLFIILILFTFLINYINKIPSSINVTRDINDIELSKGKIIKLTSKDFEYVSTQNKSTIRGYIKLLE